MDAEDKIISMNNSMIFLGFVKKEIMGLAILISSICERVRVEFQGQNFLYTGPKLVAFPSLY